MNTIYQSIWNARSGTYVAASEHAKAGGKKTAGARRARVSRALGFALKSLAASVMLAAGFNVYALPTDGAVAAGTASIVGSAGSMTVNQTSQNVSINWQSFNIGQGETVKFVQPSSSSVALNRVLGADPSSILGSLEANGQVFLINPNGVLFGQNASVNVGGLVASTLNMSDSDFMTGSYNFAGASAASVVNQGAINADGGYVALLGAQVSNQGIIQANLGTVALAAGDAITLDVAGDGLLNVAIDQGAVAALVHNGGLIQTDGGKVLMTARSAGDLFQSAVNNTGMIRARSIDNRNGTITLLGDMQSGTVSLGGTLDVSGGGAGETGGQVTATAQQVGLVGVDIDASGEAGGGTVLLGGGYQGKDPAVQHASATRMSADSSINADAVTSGDGGTVVLWSNQSTRAYGTISARGGALSGNGGLIETSGGWLAVSGIRVDAGAALGDQGTWVLAPGELTISSAATSGADSTEAETANINVGELAVALGKNNVTLATANTGAIVAGNGDVTLKDALTWTEKTTLTMNAQRDINVNETAAITATNGSMVATAGRDVNIDAATKTTTGALTLTAGNDVIVNAATTIVTGDFSLNAGQDVKLNAATTITTGDLTAVAGRHIELNAATTVTNGNIMLRADNDGTGPGADAGTVRINCDSNCITITNGALSIRFNPESYENTADEIALYRSKLIEGADLYAKAWVFGVGTDKVFDGLRDASINFADDATGAPPPVTLAANGLFDTASVGDDKLITYESTFSDETFELFAAEGMEAGTYLARADITQADPVDPDPVDPVEPVDPDPVDPVDPVDPDPVDPIDPVDPDPVDPVDPGPVDPVDPIDPDPVDPADPGDVNLPGATPEGLSAGIRAGVTNQRTNLESPPRAAGVNFMTEGTGINLQVEQLARLQAEPVVKVEEQPQPLYVAPVYAPRQDRN